MQASLVCMKVQARSWFLGGTTPAPPRPQASTLLTALVDDWHQLPSLVHHQSQAQVAADEADEPVGGDEGWQARHEGPDGLNRH